MPDIDDILGPDGLLSRVHARYEYREQQLEMAHAVDQAITGRTPLIVEAATGTGKTLAYLVPALLSKKRVVVSTGTKALQSQLFHKDLPFLAEHWHEPIRVEQLKGRRNYLCRLRYEEMKHNPRFRQPAEAKLWPDILKWAGRTDTGDRAEVAGLPDDYGAWHDISVGSEGCHGSKCPYFDDCFVFKARERAQDADIVVVNHHLFFADLALRDIGFAEILPEYDVVIFDEAHHLEDVATAYFGIQVSNWRLRDIAGDIRRQMDKEEVTDDALDAALDELDQASKEFFAQLGFRVRDGRHRLDEVLTGKRAERVQTADHQLRKALDSLSYATRACAALGESHERLAERCTEIKFDLAMILKATDDRFAYLVEVRDSSTFLQAAPIDLAELMRDKLLDAHDTLVFTSATLSAGGNFDYFKQRMGMLPADGSGSGSGSGSKRTRYTVDELILPAVFDYADQCVLYVPNKLPAPNSPDFVDNVALIVEYLVDITEGRAFVLFTSYANMHAVHELLVDKLDYTVLKQGEAPKQELLERFKDDVHSVLFATSSFWEGVDVVGDALKLVIIDKLPFANPSDPLTRARMDHLDRNGGNSFRDFSLPSAALSLKQGFGRLIRSREDTGVVAILDSRIAHKSYGRYFLESLPPAPVAWRAPHVKGWWHQKVLGKAGAEE